MLVIVLAVACVAALIAGGYKLMNSTTFQLFGGLTSHVQTDRKVVALTFDDGPTCADLPAVLAALGEVKATFFVVGEQAEACPDGLRTLVAAGHEIGNHTWTHRRMVFVTPDDIAREIDPTDAAIRAAGYTGDILVRPPYGKKLLMFPWWLHDHGRSTITWDVAVEDYAADAAPQDAATIARLTVDAVRPGSIVLLHPWNGRVPTQQAIPLVIAQLKGAGYTFATVSELLRG